MAYVDGFEHDIFISYARVNNQKGWVDYFHKALDIALSERVGREDEVKIWRDTRDLKGHQLFDQTIKNTLNSSAVFLALTSNGYLTSDYCKYELAHFHHKASDDHIGLTVGDQMRIVNLLLNNVNYYDWPKEFGPTTGFPFHDAEQDDQFGEPYKPQSAMFEMNLRKLADALYQFLKAFNRNKVHWTLELNATIDDLDKPRIEAIVKHIQQLAGDTEVTLSRIDPGSVKMRFEGDRKGFEEADSLFRLKKLTEFQGLRVKNVLLGSSEGRGEKEPSTQMPAQTAFTTATYDVTSAIEKSVESWFRAALHAFKHGDFDETLKAWSQVIALDPNNPIPYFNRANTYEVLENYVEALADNSKAISIKSDFAEAYNNRGVVNGRIGHHNDALADFQKALELKPEFSEAYHNRGITHNKFRHYEKALTDFSKAIQLKPDYVDAFLNRGLTNGWLKLYVEALSDFDKVVELKPDFAEAYNHRGVTYIYLERYDEALADLNETIRRKPDHAGAYNSRGAAYERIGFYNAAFKDYNKAIELNPDFAEAYRNRGITYGKIGRHEEELTDFDKAIELNPNFADAYNSRGAAYAEKEHHKEALANFDKAIELDPNFAQAYSNRGNIHNSLGRYENSLADHNKAIELIPDFVEAFLNRGNAYIELGRYDEALADINKAVELKPNLTQAYHNRGNLFHRLQRYEEALADYNKALELKPEASITYSNRGLTYSSLNRYKEALADYSRAIKLKFDSAIAYYNRGTVFLNLKRYDEALADYNRAINLEPDNVLAYKNLAEFYLIIQPEQALETVERVLSLSTKPSDRVIGLYLKCLALRRLGRDTGDVETQLSTLLAQPFDLRWSFQEIKTWVEKADLEPAVKQFIQEKTAMMEKHQRGEDLPSTNGEIQE